MKMQPGMQEKNINKWFEDICRVKLWIVCCFNHYYLLIKTFRKSKIRHFNAYFFELDFHLCYYFLSMQIMKYIGIVWSSFSTTFFPSIISLSSLISLIISNTESNSSFIFIYLIVSILFSLYHRYLSSL